MKALAFLALLAACTTKPTPQAAHIELDLRLSRQAAYDRATAAFNAEGLAIGQGSPDGGFLVSVPIEVATSVFVTYRATLVGAHDSTEVVLSGTVRDQPLHNGMGGQLGDAWARLERIASRLRRP